MKLLFCYDGPVYKTKDNEYYGSALNDKLFARYETITNNIKIIIRVNEIDTEKAKKQYTKISTDKYKIEACPNLSSIKGIIFNQKKCKEKLKKEIEEADYIIIRLPSMIGSKAVDIAKKTNKPYMIEMVGCPWDALWNHSIKGKFFAPIMTLITKQKIKNATDVVYVTNEFLQKRYPTKGTTISCSNVELIETTENILERRIQKINQNKEKIVLGTLAAVNIKYKGQEYVIKAISNLKKEGITNVEYQLVGGGNNQRLKKIAEKYKVSDKVIFKGSMPHNQVFEWLDNIDIYIQPSNQEGLPRALIEAMSRACPSIGSTTGGIPELLNKKTIFKKRKVKELTKILKLIIHNKKFQTKLAEENYKTSQEYNKIKLTEKRNKFYKDFIKKNNNN